LRPGGYLLLADCFLQQTEFKAPFDRHWCARIGSIAEYLAAARKAQMTLTMLKDASQLAANFWARTVALIRAEAQEGSEHPVEDPDTRESLYVHSLMRHALLRGGLRYELLSFIKL
jgi:tocopherol O-methyltransferase